MAFSVRPVRVPAALAGQVNGRLSPAILWSTPGAAGGPVVRLVKPATRAWRAMTVDAARHGHVLKAAGPTDSYRPYSVQLAIFLDRYRTYNTGSGVSVIWNGRRWWKRRGVSAAARPGTSNHGWGLAVDLGEERDGDTGTERLDSRTLAWLVANAARFGFSWEMQSEPWHLRYFAGDTIPAAVLAYERSLNKPKPPPVPEEDDVAPYSLWKFADSTKVYAVAADTQSKRHVKDPEVLAIDQFFLSAGRFPTNIHVAPAGAPLYRWLASIPTIDPL